MKNFHPLYTQTKQLKTLYNFVMTIYIETFLLQNTLINLCLLKLVNTTTKYHTTFLKLVIASLIGAVFSVISAMFLTNNHLLNLLKIICAVVMLKSAFRITKKQLFISFILLFVYTYSLGGAIISLSSASYLTNFGVVISSKFNLTFICLMIIIFTYAIDMIAKHQKNRTKTNNYIYPVELELNDNKIKINAYLDSGNLLQFNEKPVIILDLNSYLQLTKTDLINFYLNNSNSVTTNTVTGSQNLKVFKIDKITIFSKTKVEIKDQYIAINTNNSFKNTNYQALLSPLML